MPSTKPAQDWAQDKDTPKAKRWFLSTRAASLRGEAPQYEAAQRGVHVGHCDDKALYRGGAKRKGSALWLCLLLPCSLHYLVINHNDSLHIYGIFQFPTTASHRLASAFLFCLTICARYSSHTVPHHSPNLDTMSSIHAASCLCLYCSLFL